MNHEESPIVYPLTARGVIAFRLGGGALAFTGAAHLLAFSMTSFGEKKGPIADVWSAMERCDALSPGRAHTVADFHLGNGLSMGVLYVAFGVCGLLLTAGGGGKASISRSVRGVFFATAVASLALGALYFPVPPNAFFVLATAAFGVALADR